MTTVTPAEVIATFLEGQGIRRIFGLEGGHIQPIWDIVAQRGIEIIDVRDERAAVHMAHAHADLTGTLGVAMVTAGPGVTNTITAVANAHIARVPLLVIGGCPPRPQANMGPLQELPQVDLMRPIVRFARTVRVAEAVARELSDAVARAFGDGGEPGPSYIEFPTDVLREPVARHLILDEHLAPRSPRRFAPDPRLVARAVDALWSARRPVVLAGRGARGASASLVRLLDRLGGVYLDTQESRGLVPEDHPSVAGSLRGAVMGDADVILTIGRKLDFQQAYGSPAVYPNARFVRISDDALELTDNRRGDPEIYASADLALDAIVDAAGPRVAAADREWAQAINRRHRERSVAYAAKLSGAPNGENDGKMHPNRIFAAIRARVPADGVAIADGGDLLSFARIGLANATYLDSGSLGCLGVGVPFAIAAALAFPGRAVVSVNGDGAFGFNAIELDTAARHDAKAVFIVANNAAWNIERYDQAMNYDGRVVGTELADRDYSAMARALGLYAERIEDAAALEGALERALANAPALLDVVVTRDAVSSDSGKGLGFVPDYQPLDVWDEAERRRRTPVPA